MHVTFMSPNEFTQMPTKEGCKIIRYASSEFIESGESNTLFVSRINDHMYVYLKYFCCTFKLCHVVPDLRTEGKRGAEPVF